MIIEPDTHRKFTRIRLNRHVNIEFVSDSYDYCRVKNLSLAGMFAVGDFHQQVGRSCNISLVPKNTDTVLNLEALAKVVRKNDEGIAVKFTSMPLDSYIYLQTTLISEAEGPLVNEQILAEDCPFEVTDDFSISSKSFDFPKVI